MQQQQQQLLLIVNDIWKWFVVVGSKYLPPLLTLPALPHSLLEDYKKRAKLLLCCLGASAAAAAAAAAVTAIEIL